MSLSSLLRPFVRVGLPVAVAVVLVCLAVVNIALIKTWNGDAEDGVLWRQSAQGVAAVEIAPSMAGARAGIEPDDLLVSIDDEEIETPAEARRVVRSAPAGRPLSYRMRRAGVDRILQVVPRPVPGVARGLYYSLALVGILALAIGTSVRLRRPHDQATLHFFWLGVAFFGVLSFSPSGRYDRLDYFFEWADAVARLVLPPLFFHFALVFPERPHSWIRTAVGRRSWPVIYLPALALGVQRILILTNRSGVASPLAALERIERLAYVYLAVCLLGGLLLMVRALTRLRSVTARRQLRWIVWGSAVGAVPFVTVYILPLLLGEVPPYAPYTAVLLGGIPLAFASALVRYRLMDIEVLVKKGLAGAAVVLVLAGIYSGTLRFVGLVLGASNESGSFWALFATLIVALVAPGLRRAIQSGLDRLYYRDRYDYRRALVNFARELNSDLDLDRLSTRLVDRIRDTLGVDRMALFLHRGDGGYTATAAAGADAALVPRIDPASALAARLRAGQLSAVDDPVPARRLTGDEAAPWRDAGLYHFVPCVSNESAIGAIAAGRRPRGEPLNSEDMTLLAAVAAQAATALENARLYHQLSGKAEEIERLRQFSDSVIESLTDGIVVVDMQDRVLRWNKRMEALLGLPRQQAIGQRFETLFSPAFADALIGARRESPSGTTLFRVPIEARRDRTHLLLNAAICPFRTADAGQAGWIIVLEDITARANLEEQLQLSEKMAAIGLLAAGVAHEVNTPLTGISSFTQMLLEQADPADPRTGLLEKIEQQTFRAAKIVSSLLNLARPAGGETGPVDVNATLTDVLALLEHQFKVSKIQVRRQLWAEPLIVRGIEYKLQQVFLNLFLNARDAMSKGGWLSVTSSVQQHDVVVEVADTGVGIPAEHLSRIYDPFFTTKAEGRGIGLGLSVTYGIVQEHGGTLTCESDLHKGTLFRLVLPLIDRTRTEAAGAR
ncbi:MAG: GAF domain-containing protein [Acidobacteria bacterium]|nr:GAF domain-containing protein [Acidobacteriota bacterium]